MTTSRPLVTVTSTDEATVIASGIRNALDRSSHGSAARSSRMLTGWNAVRNEVPMPIRPPGVE